MEVLRFCSICLTTNGKFYDMEKCILVSSYQGLSDDVVIESLSELVCSFCHALLHKFKAFKEKCIYTQNLLQHALVRNKNKLTIEILEDLRNTHNTELPYTMSTSHKLLYDSPMSVKMEDSEFDNKFDIPTFDSDDEPLSEVQRVKEDLGNNSDKNHLKIRKENNLKNICDVKNECEAARDICNGSNINSDNTDDSEESGVKESNEKEKNSFNACISKKTLTKKEQFQEIIDRKESDKYINSSYKCEKCFRGFGKDVTYDKHMALHNDPAYGSVICGICNLRCKDGDHLTKHKYLTHTYLYTCRICKKTFKESQQARLHYEWHAGVEYGCQQCDMKFKKAPALLNHIRRKHPSSHSCQICGKLCLSERGVELHMNRKHPPTSEEHKTQHEDEETTCESCELNFHNKEALINHIESSVNKECNPQTRSCVECGRNFDTTKELDHHQKTHQNDTAKCNECNTVFASISSYQQHYQTVHLQRVHPCEFCGVIFSRKNALVVHLRKHTGERPFPCTACPKKFCTKALLLAHGRTHTGERPNKCAHCPKAFKSTGALWRHAKVHTGVRSYLCPECGKSFTQSNSLKVHVITMHMKLPSPYRKRKKDQLNKQINK